MSPGPNLQDFADVCTSAFAQLMLPSDLNMGHCLTNCNQQHCHNRFLRVKSAKSAIVFLELSSLTARKHPSLPYDINVTLRYLELYHILCDHFLKWDSIYLYIKPQTPKHWENSGNKSKTSDKEYNTCYDPLMDLPCILSDRAYLLQTF